MSDSTLASASTPIAEGALEGLPLQMRGQVTVHDRPVAVVGGVYAGDVDERLREMQPRRELGDRPVRHVRADTVHRGADRLRRALPAQDAAHLLEVAVRRRAHRRAIETISAPTRDRPAPLTLLNTFHMGGAINAVDAEATAFAERSASFMVSIDGMWNEASDDQRCIAWVRSAFDAITTHGTDAVYLNFTGIADESLDANVESAFGRNLRRL